MSSSSVCVFRLSYEILAWSSLYRNSRRDTSGYPTVGKVERSICFAIREFHVDFGIYVLKIRVTPASRSS